MKLDDLPDILTAAAIATYMSLSRRRVYELMEMIPEVGGIPCLRIGRSKRVLKIDFIAWLGNLKEA